MNEIIMSSLKADLAIMDKLDIKPNYAALARKYGLDYRTVKKYHEGYTGKPVRRNKTSILDDYKTMIQEKMKIKRINHKAIYRMLLNEYGADKIGSYSNYKAYCKKNNLVIKAKPKGNPIFETEPGDLAEVDWKENITLHNRSGEEFTINIFHIVLKFSRYSYIELTLSKEQNILFRVLINSFRFFHGIPKRLLFDNMSTVVNVSGNKKKVNGRMVQFAKDFMFEIKLCKTRSPETKGTNEARNKILDTIRAYDYEFDSYEELSKIVEHLNSNMNIEECEGTDISPILLYYKEKEYLHPLPRKEIVESYLSPAKVKVANTQLIYYKGCQYSVDYSLINEYVQPEEFNGKLYIYYKGKCVGSHCLAGNRINYTEEHYRQLMEHKINTEELEVTVQKNLMLMDQLNEMRTVYVDKDKALKTLEGMIAYIIQSTNHNRWIMRFISSLNKEERQIFYTEMKKLYPYVEDEEQFYLAFKHALSKERLHLLRFDFWLLEESCNYEFLSEEGYSSLSKEFKKEIEEHYQELYEIINEKGK